MVILEMIINDGKEMGGSVGWLMLLGIDVIIERLVKCLVKYLFSWEFWRY